MIKRNSNIKCLRCILILTVALIKLSITFDEINETSNEVINGTACDIGISIVNETATISFDRYLRYEEIKEYLTQVASKYENVTELVCFGCSHEQRDLFMIRLSTREEGEVRPIIVIEAGIHAREWLGPAMALYIIHQLIEEPENENMIAGVDWLIIPLLNPDGYEYSHTVNRKWRKNRRKGNECDGVDLNRNFDYQWSQVGSSDDECSEVYAGKQAFSEPESLALSKLMQDHANDTKLFISLHTAGQCIAYPWSYTQKLVENEEDLRRLAVLIAKRLYWTTKILYRTGPSAQILNVASGSSRDWVYAVLNVSLAYTFELEAHIPVGNETQFEMPPEKILQSVRGMFSAIRLFHGIIRNRYRTK